MSLNADDIIKSMETSAVKLFTQKAMAGLVNLGAFFGWPIVAPVVSYLVSLVVSILAVYTDWISYMLVEKWHTTAEGKDYSAKASTNSEMPPDAPDKAKAEQDQIDAFEKLISLGSPPAP